MHCLALFRWIVPFAAQSNPTALQPDRPHLGPVQLNLGVYGGVSYDDNINESQNNAESDIISRAGANWDLTGRPRTIPTSNSEPA